MPEVIMRRRGTAIVETKKGILLTSAHGREFILPGGGAEKDESAFVAALRELTEETGLKPYYAEIIFRYTDGIGQSFSGRTIQDHHTVCMVRASGEPKPGGGDVMRIGYYYPGCDIRISNTTREIIEKYFQWKTDRPAAEENNVIDEAGDSEV